MKSGAGLGYLMTAESTWSVGAIVNEDAETLRRFVAWYLDLGASHVTLLFDDPDDPSINLFDHLPQVTCLRCDDAFWSNIRVARTARFAKRQNAAMSALYRHQTTDWFLNVDGDEFLHAAAGPSSLQDLLRQQSDEITYVRIATAEVIGRAAYDGRNQFRKPMPQGVPRAVYGRDAKLFQRQRRGLIGHPQGKSLVRCRVPRLTLRQHFPAGVGRGFIEGTVLAGDSGFHLLHMIGADYDVWRKKLDWRMRSSGFGPRLTSAIEAILEKATSEQEREERLYNLHRRLHFPEEDLLVRMAEHGSLIALDLSLSEQIDRYFGADPVIGSDRYAPTPIRPNPRRRSKHVNKDPQSALLA